MDNDGILLIFHAFIQSTSIKTNFLQNQEVIKCIKKAYEEKQTDR